MKLSLKVQDETDEKPQSLRYHHRSNPLLLRAKIPVTVFGFPFLSGVAASDPPDLSLSLRTNFPSGPYLKLSYTPTSAGSTDAPPPLAVSLKSGVSLFGSPRNSPLVISAHFSFFPHNLHANPSFSLQIKPQFGDFSLQKTTYSNPNPNPKANGEVTSMGFVPLERPITWKDLSLESSSSSSSFSPSKGSLLSGIAVMAKTALPVTKHVAVNFRWGVNFPANIGKQLPFLAVNKIGIERVDEVKEAKEVESKSSEGNLELLRGMSLSLRREMEFLQKENSEIKQSLEDLKIVKLGGREWNYRAKNGDGVAKKASPMTENSAGFEQWKTKKSGVQDNVLKESRKNSNLEGALESELQKAIKAASASS